MAADTYGEMDEVFIIPSIQLNSISTNVMETQIQMQLQSVNTLAKETITSPDIGMPSFNITNLEHSIDKPIKTQRQQHYGLAYREIARIYAKKTRERKKARLLELQKYSESLLEMNENLKYEINMLKKRRDKLIQLCKQRKIR